MKKVTVLSGKGGTGKTSLTAALAQLFNRKHPVVVADCDVGSGNLPLLLKPYGKTCMELLSSSVAKKVTSCSRCGECAEVCRFSAINSRGEVDEIRCEGCGSCVYVCPEDALRLKGVTSGKIFQSQTLIGDLFHTKLQPGEEATGRFVAKIKDSLQKFSDSAGYAIIDGPPGIGCPVVAAARNSDLILVVTEPTLSAFADLKRLLELTEQLDVAAVICLNKLDLNPEIAAKIRSFCDRKGILLACELPYDKRVVSALRAGKTIVENGPEELVKKLKELQEYVEEQI